MLKVIFLPFIYTIFHLVEILQFSISYACIFATELKRITVMQFTVIKNENVLKVVHSTRNKPDHANLSIVHKRSHRGVIQLITA